MFDRLVDYLAALPEKELNTVSVEDVALCATWCTAARSAGAATDGCEAADQFESRWLTYFRAAEIESEGARQQPLLRELLEVLQEQGAAPLNSDELEYLFQAHRLMNSTPQVAHFSRPLSRLNPQMEHIARRRAETPAADPTLPSLDARLQYVTEEELFQAPRRDITFFAGVRLPFRGPLYKAKKSLKVLGAIPEDCAVAVEGNHCYVTGHVLGFLAVSRDCDILGNVSGAVISSEGAIRLCDVINKALLISKRGSVRCRSAYDPKLVFALQSIEVQQSLRRGQYIAPVIRVKDKVNGGVFHVSHEMSATHFGQDDHAALDLIFRRMLTCEDYGEALPQEASRMLTKSKMLRQRAAEYRQMSVLANAEAERLANNALLYLFGGDKAANHLAELETMQRRLAFLDRVITGTEGLIRLSENRLLLADDAVAAPPEEDGFDLDAVQDEMRTLETEGAVDADLAQGRDELLRLHRQISRSRSNPINAELLSNLYEQSAEWIRERGRLIQALDAKQVEVNEAVGRVSLLERIGADSSRLKILQQLLSAAKAAGQGDLISRRSAQPIMQMLMRRLQQRLQRMQYFQKQVNVLHEEYRVISESLTKGHQLSVPEMAEGEFKYGRAVIKGRFAAGANLYGDLHFYKAGVDAGIGHTISEDTGEAQAVFVRGGRGSVERES